MKTEYILQRFLTVLVVLCQLAGTVVTLAQMPDPPGQVVSGERPRYEAYLFAHMMDSDYGRLYYEQYPGVAYGLSVAACLEGPWFQAAGGQRPDWDKYSLPPKVRHGSMLPISRQQLDALIRAFPK